MVKRKLKPVVTICIADDWEGVYIDGVLAFTGHRVTGKQMAEMLGAHVSIEEVDEEWLQMVGDFPNNIKDIPT